MMLRSGTTELKKKKHLNRINTDDSVKKIALWGKNPKKIDSKNNYPKGIK